MADDPLADSSCTRRRRVLQEIQTRYFPQTLQAQAAAHHPTVSHRDDLNGQSVVLVLDLSTSSSMMSSNVTNPTNWPAA